MSKIKRIIRPMPRATARKCIICLALTGVCALVAVGLNNVYLMMLAIVFCAAAFVFKLQLKCPYCGARGPAPQWSKSGTIKCARCKKPLIYDK